MFRNRVITINHNCTFLHYRAQLRSNSDMPSADGLCQQLGIQHPLDKPTCIGYGQRKPTCGCLVAESSRLQAASFLDRMDHDLSHGFVISIDRLYTVAGLLHCKRFHQFQADQMAQQWSRQLERTAMTHSQPRPAAVPISTNSVPLLPFQLIAPQQSTPLPPLPFQLIAPQQGTLWSPLPPQLVAPQQSTSWSPLSPQLVAAQQGISLPPPPPQVNAPQRSTPQASTPQATLRSCSDRDLISEMRRRLEILTSTELLTAIRDIARSSLEGRAASNDGRVFEADGDNPPNLPLTNNVNTAGVNGSGSTQTTPLRSSLPTPPPSQESVRTAERVGSNRPGQSTPEATNTTAASEQPSTPSPVSTPENIRQARITRLTPASTPEPPARPPSPFRSSYVECAVCMLPYEDGDDHWECQHCLNRVHTDCFETWRASQLPNRVRCMHCRGDV